MYDQHLIPWIKAKFNLTIEKEPFGGFFVTWRGNYDLDIYTASGRTVFTTALEYLACYGEPAEFDALAAIEMGRAV